MTAIASTAPGAVTSATTAARARALLARFAAPLLGVAAGGVTLIGAGVPSFWGDEAASVMSAERSLPSLLSELSAIDAVHGLYYLLLHFWIEIAGASEFAVRLPSAVAAGAAVAGVVLLGRALFGTATGVVAGAFLAVLPEFTRLGIEARSYEFGVAAATWLTYLLVAIVRRGRAPRWMWVLYAAGAALAVWLWVFLAMIAIVHVAVLWALRAPRRTWARWGAYAAIVAVAITPIAAVTFLQRKQVAFLAVRGYATPYNVAVSQWFANPVVAAPAWILIALAVVGALRMRRDRRRRAVAMGVWLAGPTAIILAMTAWVTPVYNQRYLAFSMPAVALALAIGTLALLRGLAPRRLGVAVAALLVAALVAGAVPAFLSQRSPYGKGGADFRQTAEVLHEHAAAGDAVVFDGTVKPSQRPRVILHLYPADTAGLVDVGIRTPDDQRAGIWDSSYPVADIADRLVNHDVVWAVEVRGSGSPDLAQLRRLGYVETASYPVNRTVVHRLVKETP